MADETRPHAVLFAPAYDPVTVALQKWVKPIASRLAQRCASVEPVCGPRADASALVDAIRKAGPRAVLVYLGHGGERAWIKLVNGQEQGKFWTASQYKASECGGLYAVACYCGCAFLPIARERGASGIGFRGPLQLYPVADDDFMLIGEVFVDAIASDRDGAGVRVRSALRRGLEGLERQLSAGMRGRPARRLHTMALRETLRVGGLCSCIECGVE